MKGTLGYNLNDSFKHLSKYGILFNADMVSFPSFSSIIALTSFLTHSYQKIKFCMFFLLLIKNATVLMFLYTECLQKPYLYIDSTHY